MDPCYHPKVYNCKKEKCPQGFECCTQKVDHMGNDIKDQVYGVCVQKNMCNEKTGGCQSGKYVSHSGVQEKYNVNQMENYGTCQKDYQYLQKVFWVLCVLIITILVILCVTKR